jgi:hypothetical protein
MLISLLLAARAARFIHAAAFHFGAEVVDTADCGQVLGKVISAVFGDVAQEEGDGVWTAVESKSAMN